MGIQGISLNAPINTSSQQPNPRLKGLEQQISALRKQLQEVRNDQRLNARAKEEKIKEVEKKIQILEQEKTQIQAEERQKKQKNAENEQRLLPQEAETEKNTIDDGTQKAFAKMESAKKIEKDSNIVREQLEGEMRIAESKAYSHSGSRANPVKAAEARGKIERLDRTVLNAASEVIKEFEKSAKYDLFIKSIEDKQGTGIYKLQKDENGNYSLVVDDGHGENKLQIKKEEEGSFSLVIEKNPEESNEAFDQKMNSLKLLVEEHAQKDKSNNPYEMHICETVIERPDPDNPDKYVIVSQRRLK